MRFVHRVALVGLLTLFGSAHAQVLSQAELLKALQQGGKIVLMRHATVELPDAKTANPDNKTHERQLDAAGRQASAAMGKALRDLKIPVGAVLSSPTYRALETAKQAQLSNPQAFAQLGDADRSESAQKKPAGVDPNNWLRQYMRNFPQGTNTFVVTHSTAIKAALPDISDTIDAGESLVYGPDGQGGAALLGRIKIEEWPKLGK